MLSEIQLVTTNSLIVINESKHPVLRSAGCFRDHVPAVRDVALRASIRCVALDALVVTGTGVRTEAALPGACLDKWCVNTMTLL